MGRALFWTAPSREKVHEVFSLQGLPSEDSSSSSSSGGKNLYEEAAGFVAKSVKGAGKLLLDVTRKLRWAVQRCNAQDEGYREAVGGLVEKAQVFRQGLLPLGNQMVENLEDLAGDYVELNPAFFAHNVRYLLEKMRNYRNHAELARLFYAEMAKDLKDLKKEFQTMLISLKKTGANLEAAAEKKRKSRTWSEHMAILATVLGVGATFIVGTVATVPAIATGITGFVGAVLGSKKANQYRTEEISLKANADIARKSSLLIESGVILDRLLEFSQSMASIGECFKTVEHDLALSIGTSQKSNPQTKLQGSFRDRVWEHQKRHVRAMKQISTSCRSYAMDVAQAENNLCFMNNVALNSNYVEEWLIRRGSACK